MPSSLHPDILALVEMSPIEDLLLALLTDKLPGVEVRTLIADDQTFPLALVRRYGDWGAWNGDERFIDTGQVVVHTYCEGLEADSDAALLAEAIRVVLRDSKHVVVPARGHLTGVNLVSAPRRVSDWATATGPVQFADLPTGVMRYETVYDLTIKRSRDQLFPPSP